MKREDFKEVKILLEREIMELERRNNMINAHGLTPTEIQEIDNAFKAKINPFKATLELIRLATRTKQEIALDCLIGKHNHQQSLGR